MKKKSSHLLPTCLKHLLDTALTEAAVGYDMVNLTTGVVADTGVVAYNTGVLAYNSGVVSGDQHWGRGEH